MKKNSIILSCIVILGISIAAYLFTHKEVETSKSQEEIGEVKKTELNIELNKEQKRRAEALTSVFENGTPEIDYVYAEDLNDGRGFTCGRAGFTTGTGDAYIVVKKYTELNPENKLAKYLPALETLENERVKTGENQGDVSEISKMGDFGKDWAASVEDTNFIKIQDETVDELYYKPSLKISESLGLKLPLSKAVLYDTIIQHGNGDDPDSINAIVSNTNKKSGGTPKTNVDEKIWLKNFLDERKAVLSHSYNEESREEWAESTQRVDVLMDVFNDENYNLDKPITVKQSDWDGVEIK